jgi:hypothetical protein
MQRTIIIISLLVTLATTLPQTQVCAPGEVLVDSGCIAGLKTYFPIAMR